MHIERLKYEVNDPEALVGLIRRGIGITFISEKNWKRATHLLPEKIQINEPNWKRTIGISWSNKNYLSIEAQQFKDHVIEYFANT